MEDLLGHFLLVLVVAAVVAIQSARVYALIDVVFRQRGIGTTRQVVWFALILIGNVLASVPYLRWGPGASHWPPTWLWHGGVARDR